MAAAATPASPPAPSPHGIKPGVQPLRAGQGHSYFWRKLHSLSGIVPIGAFLIEHIISNFEAINGPLAYAKQVLFLNSLPMVRILEWAFIFIPLAFHAGYGVFIWLRGRSNVNVYPWVGNKMYLMQRVTGVIALAYIIQHVWRQRFSGVSLPEHPGAAFAKVQHELHNPWMLAIYIIAMIATCWHFSAGVWLFAAKWGITPGDRARKKFGYVCAVAGSALCIMGLVSIYAFVGPKYQNAPADVMPEQPAGITMPAPTTPSHSSTNPAPSPLQQ
jgi:Succinate dehydrogenase/fumarate reductase, cytochrome b subunit